MLDEIDRWLQDSSAGRAFVLVGGPGTGKTALSAHLVQTRSEIVASHFCSHASRQKSEPVAAVRSLAYYLSSQLPAYQERLRSIDLSYILSEYDDAVTLFDILVTQQLVHIEHAGAPLVVLIDALDEAGRDGRNALAEIVGSEFLRTPEWLRLICTTRPEPEVMWCLQGLAPNVLDATSEASMGDIREYVEGRLLALGHAKAQAALAAASISCDSEGVFLYAVAACDEVCAGGLAALDSMPRGLGSMLQTLMRRRVPDVGRFRSACRPLLSLILASYEPMGHAALRDAAGLSAGELNDALTEFGSLIRDEPAGVVLFHKSLADWLQNRATAGPYFCDVADGHALVADALARRADAAISSEYVRRFGQLHAAAAGRWDLAARYLEVPGFDDGGTLLVNDVVDETSSPERLLRLAESVAARGDAAVRQFLIRLIPIVQHGGWRRAGEVLEVLAPSAASPETIAILRYLRAWMQQLTGRLADSLRTYSELRFSDLGDIEPMARFREADACRESGLLDRAQSAYEELVGSSVRGTRDWGLFSQQYADILYVRGRVADAQAVLRDVIESEATAWPEAAAEALRISGHISRMSLEEASATASYDAARSIFEEIGSRSGLARIETNLAETMATCDPESAIAHAESAIAQNTAIEHPIESGKAVRAMGLALGFLGRFDEARSRLAQAMEILEATGYRAGVCWTMADMLWVALLSGQQEQAMDLFDTMAQRLDELDAYPVLTYRSAVLLEEAGAANDATGRRRAAADECLQWIVDRDEFHSRLKASLRR